MEGLLLLLVAAFLAYTMSGTRSRTHVVYMPMPVPDEDRPADGCLPLVVLLLIGFLVLAVVSLQGVPM